MSWGRRREEAILEAFSEHGELTGMEVVGQSGVSRGMVYKTLQSMESRGLLVSREGDGMLIYGHKFEFRVYRLVTSRNRMAPIEESNRSDPK